ncbi:MAG: M1 family peptidase, partial [Flavobacteriaceae bacterium]|nr:M1 family peptidase [Flavobacteriaceae bacterium]
MKFLKYSIVVALLFSSATVFSQETEQEKEERELGHINDNKFRQLYQEFSTPNQYRTAAGAPGHAYYQQKADYKMDIELDDKNKKLYGVETITYYNNSPDDLEYLWVQLDQNVRAADSQSPLRNGGGVSSADMAGNFVGEYMGAPFDGGFKIDYVKDANGKALSHTVNQTMMRIN